MKWRIIQHGLVLLAVTCKFVSSAPEYSALSEKISIDLDQLHKDARIDILVRMSADTSSVIQSVSESNYENRNELLSVLHSQLVAHAEKTQRSVLEYLTFQQTNFPDQIQIRGFWATNQIFVKGANAEIIKYLATNFDADIHSIRPNTIVAQIAEPAQRSNATKLARNEREAVWGLERIQTREAWKELGIAQKLRSRSFQEIRIATQDTGVRYTHEALRDNFLGGYGWYDPTHGESHPVDKMGHGSHTTGTIAGSQGIGVAPWVKWMTCRGCSLGLGCTEHDLLACGEFFVCPHNGNGSSFDCSKAPHLVSNSWSGGQGLDWYNDIIAVWQAAKIIPIFSIGNFGNAFCGSANYPGDLPNVIGVGSTTIDDDLSWFSSIGPTRNRGTLIKPDVVAPGSDIWSASNKDDTSYELMSGTSMSCPHVSGIVALLLTQNPDITFEQAKEAITASTEHGLKSRQLTCQGIPDTKYPNQVYGHGIASALKSVIYARPK